MRRIAMIAAVALLASAPGVRATSGSLPAVSAGPRPGPAVLYEPLATAPQLTATAGWTAPPLMVSGADAYDAGEYLFQDFIYDDHGANTNDLVLAQPDSVPNDADVTFGGMTGDVVYPTDAATYAYNAADLLEFRARPVTGGVAYRITLNTMLDPGAAAVAIGIDTDRDASTGTDDWGSGIGVVGHVGLEHVVVASGDGATLDGEPVPASVNTDTNQIEVTVPMTPGSQTWRHYLGVGLWDSAAKAFKRIADQPTASSPGGANGTAPPPFFNVGFRYDAQEPMMRGSLADPLNTGSRTVGYGHWREHAQAKALAARDIAAFHADIDFATLNDGVTESHVPGHGYLNRLYASHLGTGIGAGQEGAQPDRPMLLGKIQPYSIWIPSSYDGSPLKLLLNLHSLSCSYNQFMVFSPNTFTQLGDERDSFILTFEGRGPDGWYHDEAEVDVFEAWADAASHYAFDPDHTDVTGYSMGGYGTYKMAAQYPDLFGRAWAVVGPADEAIQGGPTAGLEEDSQNTLNILENLRNLPLLMWNGGIDELVPVLGTLNVERRLSDLGLAHELNLFPASDHFQFSIVDQWGPGVAFLDGSSVDRNPSRVFYKAMPEMDAPSLGIVHDHAYWVGDIRVAAGTRAGTVDARSLARGDGIPIPAAITGASPDPTPNIQKGLTLAPSGTQASNELILSLNGIASVSVWLDRAGLDPSQPIQITAEAGGPVEITLYWGANVATLTLSPGESHLVATPAGGVA